MRLHGLLPPHHVTIHGAMGDAGQRGTSMSFVDCGALAARASGPQTVVKADACFNTTVPYRAELLLSADAVDKKAEE